MAYNYEGYASGTYSFEAYQDVNPTASLTLGQEVTGTIADPGDQATYTFTGSPGQRVYLDSHLATSGLYATLTSPYGTQVFSDYLPSGGQGPYTLSQAGTYTLTIYGSGGSTGAYDFILDDAAQATSIALTAGSGTTETGTLATGLATDLYSFSGTAGQIVFFQGLLDSPGSAAVAWLYAPGANGSNPYSNYEYLEDSGQWTLPSTGTYLIAVRGQGYTTGTVSYQFDLFDNTVPTSSLTLGHEVTGTLTNPGDEHNYTFTGSIGQQVYFDPRDQTSGFYAYLANPSGSEVFSAYFPSGDYGPYTLTQAGTYTLTIYGSGTNTGAYDFSLDDLSAATPIALTAGSGTTVTGTLATGLTTNLYSFSGTAGQLVYFKGLQDSPGSSAIAYLYGPNSNYITYSYTENSVQWTLPGTGTYTVAVAGVNGTTTGSVSYQFELFDNVNPSASLTLGQEVTGTLTNPGDQATYTFTGTGGQRIYFDSRDATTYVAAELTAPNGGNVFDDYFSSGDEGPYILNQAGTYTLTVYANYGYTGAYDFSLDDTSKATALTTGTLTNGTLATGLTTNLYQFSGTAGQRIYFDGQSDSPASSAYATLYSPSNSAVSGGSFYLENKAAVTLPSTGTYLLAVAGQNGTTTGSVSYQFEAYDNVDPTTALTLGQEVTGTLTNPGDQASYTFTGSVGQQVYFDSRDQTSGLYAELLCPDGSQVFDAYFPYNDYGPYTLNQAGTYTLTVYGSGLSAGAYDFSLDDIGKAPTIALTAGSGTTVTGTLASGLTTNLYTFSGTAGQRIYFQGLQDSPGSSAYVYLYSPTYSDISNQYAENSTQWTLPGTGTYTVAVTGINTTTTGTVGYQFELFDNVNPTASLTLGQEVTGTLANPGDQASYTFSGSAGQRVWFDGRVQANNVLAQLTSPDGGSVFNSYSYADEGPYVLNQAGTYTLTVYSYSGYTGAYDFSLDDIGQAPAIALTPGSGTTVTGTLATGLTTDLYTFTGAAGQRIYFQGLQDSTASTALAILYAPNNSYITEVYTENSGQWTLPGTGTYTLAVYGNNSSASGPVAYQFTLYDNANPSTSLTLGSAVTGMIANPGDEASYTFTGSPGQRVFYDGQSAASGIDAYFTNPSGNQVFNIGAAGDAGIYTLSEPGTYTLTIYGNGNTGAYTFNMLDASAQSLAPTSTPATVNGTMPGTGTTIYQIAGSAGETITLTSDSFTSTSGSWYLVDPNNASLGGASFGTSFTETLGLTGPYELVLQGSDTTDSSVTYQFDISATPAASATPSGFGTTQSGTLATTGSSISFTYTAPAGLPVFLDTLTNSNGYLYAVLTDPNNNTVFSYYASSITSPYILPASGTYTLTLTSESGSIDYSVDLIDLHASATALTLGSLTSGTLNPGNSIAAYSFTGSTGQDLFLNNQDASSTSVTLEVMDSYGNRIVSIGPGSDGGPLTLTAPGTYYLLAVGSSSTAVGYQFQLTDTSTVPLSFGTAIDRTISNASQSDVVSFTGTAGQSVYFHELSSSNGYYGAYWYLYGPNNQSITSDWLGGDLSATLPISGTYTLVAYNYEGYTLGTYSFEAYQNVNPTASLTLGQEVTGTIANPGDEATYTFTGSPGQRVYLDSHLATGGLYATLVSSYGTQFFSDALTSGGQGPYTLTQAGTYTLTIYGSGAYTGAYDFILGDASKATTIALTAGSGTTETGTLATGLATDLYQFSGTAGQLVFFKGLLDSPSSNTVAYLYDPGATGSNPYQTYSYLENSVQWTLPSTGTYLIAVRGQGYTTGTASYQFELFDNVNPTAALTLGQEVTGTIANPGDEATYTFTGSIGQRVYLDSHLGTTASTPR